MPNTFGRQLALEFAKPLAMILGCDLENMQRYALQHVHRTPRTMLSGSVWTRVLLEPRLRMSVYAWRYHMSKGFYAMQCVARAQAAWEPVLAARRLYRMMRREFPVPGIPVDTVAIRSVAI